MATKKGLSFGDLGLTDKDVVSQKRIDVVAAMAILEGRVAATERLDCFIYRVAPKPPDRPKGTPAYICRLETPLYLDDLRARLGGGVYRIVGNSFSEKDESTGQRKTVVDFLIEIDGAPLGAEVLPAPGPKRAEVSPGDSPLVERPGIGESRPSQRGRFDGGGFSLQDVKALLEIARPAGGNGKEYLDAFMSGITLGKELTEMRGSDGGKGEGSSVWDVMKEVVRAVAVERPVRRMVPRVPPSPNPSISPSPSAQADRVVVEPPAVAVGAGQPAPGSLATIDALLNFLMDSFDDGKTSKQAATELVPLVPPAHLSQIFGWGDGQIVEALKGWTTQYGWMDEGGPEKVAWLADTVKEARSLLPVG